MTASLFPELIIPRSSKAQYRRQVQAVILRRALRGEEVTADDVHAVLPCPEGVDSKNLGIAFYGLAKAGIIVPVRYTTSSRTCRHNGLYRAWRVADAVAARVYLSALEKTGDGHGQ